MSSPVPPVPQPPKKGMSPWVWVGIGCVGVLVVGGVIATLLGMFVVGKVREAAEDPVAAAARLIAAANPDIELVEADKEARVVKFRDTKSGEEFTISYEDIEKGRVTFASGDEEARIDFDAEEGEEGRLTVTTDEGTATFGAGGDVSELPSWVPVYSGSSAQGTFSSETGEMRAGGFGFETQDSLEAVLGFYTSRLEAAGLEIRSRTTTPDGALLVAASSDESKTATVTLTTQDGGLGGFVNFAEKK